MAVRRIAQGSEVSAAVAAAAASSRADIVVYAPGSGDHVAGSNVYPTFAAAYAAVAAGPPRSQKIIQIDDADDPGNAVVGAGAYDFFHRIEIWGPAILPDSEVPVLTVEDGVTFTRLSLVSRSIRIRSESTSPVITDGGEVSMLVEAGARLECAAGAAPMVEVPAAGTFLLILREGSEISDGDAPNGQKLIDIDDAGAQLIVAMFGNVIVENDIIEGPGVLVPFWGGSGPTFGAQPAHTGALVTFRSPSTENIGYTPSTEADWVDPDPTTAQEALDRIAGQINDALLGGPIP